MPMYRTETWEDGAITHAQEDWFEKDQEVKECFEFVKSDMRIHQGIAKLYRIKNNGYVLMEQYDGSKETE